MGGRSDTRTPRSPAVSRGSSSDGKGEGNGNGTQPGDLCPAKITASVTGPVQGITAGSWLDVVLHGSRVVFVDPISGRTIGALMGVPNLSVLIQCLLDGVVYRAFIVAVQGGRVDVTIVRQ